MLVDAISLTIENGELGIRKSWNRRKGKGVKGWQMDGSRKWRGASAYLAAVLERREERASGDQAWCLTFHSGMGRAGCVCEDSAAGGFEISGGVPLPPRSQLYFYNQLI